MLEHLDGGTGQLEAEDEGSVVELVGDDEAPLRGDPRQVEAVGGETHAERDGVLHPQKLGHRRFELAVDGQSAELERSCSTTFNYKPILMAMAQSY